MTLKERFLDRLQMFLEEVPWCFEEVLWVEGSVGVLGVIK